MDFPDLPHLLQLRNDLWQWPSARAAVMVGAGFSRNSMPSPGVSTRFPTWHELAQAMFNEIYPAPLDETAEQKTNKEERFNRINELRLASEYAAAFGPQRLESFIRARIPDTDHQPGNLHKLLLQLPWKDVFTTNYDTLLERTEVDRRVYQPVTKANELTTAFSPRIIKLHGSFPSETPFIITEEHYRTYPKDFAPFVNTVLQSLLENTFVLIGFSGDDPNFLQWIGWIRDELGDRHASIYLVGPLSLNNVQRSLLAERGVTPIDLTPIFLGTNRPGGIHKSAIEWFLRSLLKGEPQRPEEWPKPKTNTRGTADFHPPILTTLPEPEVVDSSVSFQSPLDEATVIKVIERWRFERNRYPGWLVPTDQLRSSLWHKTRDWIEPLIKFVENWPPADRILLFRETNWRLETSMVPLFSDWIIPFESAVNELFADLQQGILTKPTSEAMRSINVSDTEVAEAWMEIAFALLREARETYNSERWNAFKVKIDQVVVSYPEFTDRYQYEQALWMMWNLERGQAKKVLAKWAPSSHSLLAMMWKAGLLAELDELSEAHSLLRTALLEIRKALNNSQGRNIDLLSLEGWCTYLLFYVEAARDLTRWTELHDEFSERWQELKAWDCNPQLLKSYFDSALSATPPVLKKTKQISRDFDPWSRTITHHLGGPAIEPWLPAFACIRLYEQVGIPLRVPRFTISGDALRTACKWVAPFTGFWSPALLIRVGKRDDLTKYGFMDRAQVAAMKPALAKNLNKWAIGALHRELSSLSSKITRGSFQESLLKILIEVLSRLAFKLESADLQQAFSLALEFHRQPGIPSNISLHHSCEPWFKRLFEAADDRQLLAWLPELLRFPLSIESTQLSNPLPNPWPDPISCNFPELRVHPARTAYPELLTDIHETIEWLLERAKSESGEGRRRAVMRLISVFYAKVMTPEQQQGLGTLLWEKLGENGLPDVPGFHCFRYLDLPEPATVDVVSKVRAQILSIEVISNKVETDLMILNAARASKAVVHIPDESRGRIEWSLDETKELWNKIIQWWDKKKDMFPVERSAPFVGDEQIAASLDNAGEFLARAILPKMGSASEDDWNKVLAFLSETRRRGLYLTTVLPYVLLHRSSEKERVNQTILDDLSSDNEEAVKASACAVRHWIHLADARLLDNLPIAAVDILIQRVVFRRLEGIQTCLNQLAALLIEKPDVFNSDQVNLVVASLTPWSHATRLPLSEERDADFSEEERPELRVLLGWLASALSIWLENRFPDQPEPTEISHLRESYKSDPLPEVRRAFEWWKYLATNSSN